MLFLDCYSTKNSNKEWAGLLIMLLLNVSQLLTLKYASFNPCSNQ